MSAVTVHTSTAMRHCSEVGHIWLYYHCLSGCCSAAGVRKKQLLLHNCAVKPLFFNYLGLWFTQRLLGFIARSTLRFVSSVLRKAHEGRPTQRDNFVRTAKEDKNCQLWHARFLFLPEGKMLEMPLILQHGTLISSPQNTAEATSNLSQHNPPEAWKSQPDKVPFSKPRSIKRKSDWKALHQKKVPCY